MTIDPRAFSLGHVVAARPAETAAGGTPLRAAAKKTRSDKGKEELDEDSSSLREITNN